MHSMNQRALVLFGSLVGAALLAIAPSAWGQAATERIHSYSVDIGVQRDGSLTVVERIDYDFGSSPHHGIFRDIPVRFSFDDRNDRIYPLQVTSVTASAGAPAGYKTSTQGGSIEIKIGDPNKTVTGPHVYTIAYRVRGALNAFVDHDELYWNAIGAEWGVPIDRAVARVTVPAGVLRIGCFAGPTGSSLPCQFADARGATATFRQTSVDPYEGLTVVAGFPTGAVTPSPKPILVERWSLGRAFSITPVTLSLTSVLMAGLLFGLGWLFWTRGRDRRAVGSPVDIAYGSSEGGEQSVPLLERGTYPVEYAPPEGIHPGQVGTLLDEVANTLDVTATIVDLAVRGYLRIEEIPKKHMFGKPDWRLVRLKAADDGLLAYERTLLSGLFEGADDDTVVLSDLRTHFARRLSKVQDGLYENAVSRKWFSERPDRVRQVWARRGWLTLIGASALLWLAVAKTHLALIVVPVVLTALVLIWGAHLMPRRTPKGTGMIRRVLGFRTYIETAEKDEAQFAERANLFSQYLPYAIVFGCTEKWARAFRGLAEQEQAAAAGWYVGTHPFTTAALVSSIDSFAVTTAGTITSTPAASGSSGFGGGGFSGGGGGGGGGGSW
jgi:uncharacterized membrane protein YgcG